MMRSETDSCSGCPSSTSPVCKAKEVWMSVLLFEFVLEVR